MGDPRKVDFNKPIPIKTGRSHSFVLNIKDLNLQEIGKAYKDVAQNLSQPLAEAFLLSLDYPELVTLAKKGIKLEGSGEATKRTVVEPKNDPNHLDENVILLWGMKNERVTHTQSFLAYQGYACPKHGILDDETWALHQKHIEKLGQDGVVPQSYGLATDSH